MLCRRLFLTHSISFPCSVLWNVIGELCPSGYQATITSDQRVRGKNHFNSYDLRNSTTSWSRSCYHTSYESHLCPPLIWCRITFHWLTHAFLECEGRGPSSQWSSPWQSRHCSSCFYRRQCNDPCPPWFSRYLASLQNRVRLALLKIFSALKWITCYCCIVS